MPDVSRLPPVPLNNEERLRALAGLCVLDTAPEAGFDEVTAFVAQVCDVPVSLVSLVDRNRQWFKSAKGFDAAETDLPSSICAYVVYQDEFLEIEDLTIDPRTQGNPLVTPEDGIRFYAGVPLRLSNGLVMGSLCAIDTVPRRLSAFQRETMTVMARQVVAQLELKQAVTHAEMLKREVDHRVKNSLQSISSLTRIQARKAPNEDVRAALLQVQSRIEMVAALHEQLYRTSAGNEVNLAIFAEKVGVILSATSGANVTVEIDFETTLLSAEQASAIGVILNEFASNSFKHAFPDGRNGTIRFAGRIKDGDHYVIEFSDNGIGMGAISHTSGIGLAVIEASVAQLGGAWEPLIGHHGTSARMTIPRERTYETL